MSDFANAAASYRAGLLTLARKLTNRNLEKAEDLVQDTLLRAIEKQHQFQPGTSLRAWLSTILRNLHYNTVDKRYFANQGIIVNLPDDAEAVFKVPADQETTIEARGVLALLDRMPPAYRRVLMETAVGTSDADQAAADGVAENSISTRRTKARRHLAALLECAA